MTAIQRFSGALNLHVHFHTLALDGVYAVGQVRGALGHPPAAATRAEAAALAGERHQALEAAAVAAHAGEAVGERTAGEEAAQLGLDEGGYAGAVAVGAGGLEKLLQVVADDRVQHGGRAGAGAVDFGRGPPRSRYRTPGIRGTVFMSLKPLTRRSPIP